MLPPGWEAPGWSNNQIYWLDTVAQYTTWAIPTAPAGAPPDPKNGAVGIVRW